MRWVFLLFLHISLFATDFDCIFVGSSPFSLFEALYQANLGNRVLLLEQADECGGAWRGINVCGIMHADLGCHQVGNDSKLKSFLEEYAGCKIVSIDHPEFPFETATSPNGWYFSRGCYELIENLLKLLHATDIVLLTSTKAESVFIHSEKKFATVKTKDQSFTATKLFVTPTTSLNLQPCSTPQNFGKSKHYHLYLLVQDPTLPRFSYQGGVVSGTLRLMNLTHFVGLVGSGRQLIVFQTCSEQDLNCGQTFLDELKKNHLIDSGAYILDSEGFIYESGAFHQGLILTIGAQEIIEVIQTGHFQNLASYIPKWVTVLKPFHEACSQ